MRVRLVVLLVLLLSLAGAAQAWAEAAAGARIGPILRETGFSGTGTGVAVVDVDTGELVYRHNAWRRLIPASNEKVFTAVAALAQLGPQFRFTTKVVGAGVRQGATFKGNLYLVGAGDPTFGGNDMASLARQVRASGIRRITGRIFGDETVFDPMRYGPKWKRTYYGIESPPLSGLAYERNVDWTSGRVVDNPPRAAARALRKALERRGVEVVPRFVAVGHAPKVTQLLATSDSLPLWRIARYMNRRSDNFTAEMLLKAVGAYAGAGGSTAEGIAVEQEVLSGLVPDDSRLVTPVDGSGLSRANRSTATMLARLLAGAAADAKLGPALQATLAIPGRDGTLEQRLYTCPNRQLVRAKTGTLNGVSSLSGYVTSTTGRRYAFSILMNGDRLSHWLAHQAQDRIVASLARGR